MNGRKHLLKPLAQCRSLLQRFKATRSLTSTKLLHARIIVSGLLSTSGSTAPVLSNLALTYALCGHVPHAAALFDELPVRSPSLCNALIRMYNLCGRHYEALYVFVRMLASGWCPPDYFTYTFVCKACSDLSLLDVGFAVHGKVFAAGFDADTFVQNALLALYMNCGAMGAARKVFDEMHERTVVSWNTMISGYFKNSYSGEAVMLFKLMMSAGVEPDSATVVSVLPACGNLKELDLGKCVHNIVEEKGLGNKNIAVSNALLDMYAKCGRMDEAQAVFHEMDKRDVVTWSAMINGYALNGDVGKALNNCRLMQFDGVKPNPVTISSLLSACSSSFLLKLGRCFHGWSMRQKLESDVTIETALIDMYAKCKRVDVSFHVLARALQKKTAPWNAVLSGCVHNGLAKEAIQAFKQMLIKEIEPNLATVNSLLPAYAILADLQQAMNIHGYVARSGLVRNVEIITGLIDIYAKCGRLESAHRLFNDIPRNEKDIVVWSVIVAGYGMHGHGEAAVLLFKEMVHSGVNPNEVTFTSVLHACSHAGLVEEGLDLFNFMLHNNPVKPHFDHYTCMVDLLGRAGRLQEAYGLIRTMPFKPNHAVWGALLGACVIHENVELGEIAAKWLFELEPENTGNYVLLAKIYSALGRWKDAEDIRHMMKKIGLRKAPAHSLV
ncbi:pentatricopeptide repeat-containing protein At5g39350 [Rhodamnia argentea]|uniref:Pentatricopeptide repeat-containing protein At5g39350 n=1 Tax=Rhodamnia argentea TaxID=178133 RepID=A0A8B8MUQ4_9MYRT|nr:pentatricopeptide repeat-containing protein At5g39350 [Rhodamnia argentea]XP_030513767.1 pentatricopeptide repeat-containing protein At5g39350 [Rhodamnia argentea]XP_030513768.1 pentatricopeptide repeat-containing protein At5g39350 [Rhodamnia argentea]XP_030513769.1 pentatricopeptide repeat-containing protein At5g39350 [Rhodamnia argentea]